MQKSYLTLFILLFPVNFCFGQAVTITAANFNPLYGEAFITHNCDTTGVLQGSLGANQVWDFTTLTTTSIDTGVGVPCLGTPNCAMFPGSTIAIVNPTATMTTYLIYDATKISQNGYYASATQNATFTNPMDELHYPFTYLDSFTDAFAGTLIYTSSSVTISAQQHGTEKVICDGYGMLKLPGRIAPNVIRVHASQIYIDSTNLFGTSVIDSFQFDSYAWYEPNFHTALLTVSFAHQIGGSISSKIVTYVAKSILSVPTISNANKIDLYPNPASGQLYFTMPEHNYSSYTITNSLGAFIASNEITNIQTNINICMLPSGLYFITFKGKDTIQTMKFFKN